MPGHIATVSNTLSYYHCVVPSLCRIVTVCLPLLTLGYAVGTANGQISLPAWKATVDMLGLEYPDNVLVGLFARYDTNQNGFIEVHELQKGLLPVFETQFPRLGAAQVEQVP